MKTRGTVSTVRQISENNVRFAPLEEAHNFGPRIVLKKNHSVEGGKAS